MRAPSLIGIALTWFGGLLMGIGLTHFTHYQSSDNEEPVEAVAAEPATEIINIGNCGADNLLCVHEDAETGCHYVRSYHGGVTPRLRADGSVWCGTNEGSL